MNTNNSPTPTLPPARSLDDAGSVSLALDLAAEGLGWPRQAPQALSPASLSSLSALADEVAEVTGMQCRVRELTFSDLGDMRLAGMCAIFPVRSGWVCVRPRDVLHVGHTGKREEKWNAQAFQNWAQGRSVEGLVCELPLGLESLSVRQTKSKKPWARLYAFLRLEARDLWALVIYSVVLGAMSLAVPVAVQVLVNTIAVGALRQPLVVLSFLLLLVLMVFATLSLLRHYAVELMQRRMFVRVSEDLVRRLANFDAHLRDHYDARELSNRFFEVVTLQKAMSQLLSEGLGLLLQATVSMLLLAFYHPYLLAFDVLLVLGMVVVVALGRGAVGSAIAESEAKYKMAGWLESASSSPTLMAKAQGQVFSAIYADGLIRDYLRSRNDHFRAVFRQTAAGVGMQIFALVSLLGLGGWLVMRGELTLGQLVAAELVVGAVGSSFAKAGKLFESGYDFLASLDKLGKILDMSNVLAKTTPSEPLPQTSLTVKGLCAEREGREIWNQLSFEVPPQGRLRVVGPDGAGKTTLLEMLAGLRTPHAGSALWGNLEFSSEAMHLLKSHAFYLRPFDVVQASVLDNLRLAAPLLTEEEALQVLREVHLEDVVAKLEDGLHTLLLSNGSPLSSAQLRRLCVARALLVNPSLLLVDGALDDVGLTPEDTDALVRKMLGPQAPWTAIVVTEDARVQAWCRDTLKLGRQEAA